MPRPSPSREWPEPCHPCLRRYASAFIVAMLFGGCRRQGDRSFLTFLWGGLGVPRFDVGGARLDPGRELHPLLPLHCLNDLYNVYNNCKSTLRATLLRASFPVSQIKCVCEASRRTRHVPALIALESHIRL